MKLNIHPYLGILLALGAIVFFPFLGHVHLFDWDEVMFAEFAREMLVTGDYTRIHDDFKPFWEKPPFFMWLQVLSMKIWGVNEYAARFPNAIAGILTLSVVFLIGKKLYTPMFGLAWGCMYLCSILPHLYFKSAIIDPWFNLFIFLGIYGLIIHSWRVQSIASGNILMPLILGGTSLGLALITKGPVGVLIPGLVIAFYWALSYFRKLPTQPLYFFVFLSATFAVALLWYGVEVYLNGTWFITHFIEYQIDLLLNPAASDHKGFLGFHFVVVLFGCFPASVLALRAFNRRFTLQDNTIQQDFHLWMLILFWVVIVLFSLVVTKIVHYSSLTYFPLTYLAALSIVDARPFQLWQRWLSWAVATVLSVALMLVPILGMYRNQLVPYIKDPFAVANLQADVQFSVLESLIGILPLLAIFCFYYYRKIANYTFAIYSIAAFGILLVSSIIIIYPAKIEPITQGAAVEFFQSLKGKDCYVQTLEYRSYVHLFYQQQPKPTNLNYYRTDFKTWLLEGDIDKDAYFSVKINKSAEYKKRKDLKVLYEKNGFVFLYRKAVGTNRY